MRTNLPVTDTEYELADDVALVSMTDLDSYITYANPALARMFGEHGAAAVIGHSVLTFHAPEVAGRLSQQRGAS